MLFLEFIHNEIIIRKNISFYIAVCYYLFMDRGREQHRGEPSERQQIRFEGPSVLEKGQNIYDQPPFDRVVWASFQESGISAPGLRRMVSQVADRFHSEFGTDRVPSQEEMDNKLSELLQLRRETFRGIQRDSLRETGSGESADWRPVLTKLCRSLVRYPLWYSYSADARSVSRYSPSGDKIREVTPGAQELLELPIGYGAWLERLSQRQQRITSLTVDTIFEEASDPNRQLRGRKGREWKRWAFLGNESLRIENKPSRLPSDISGPPFPKPETRSETE
ncbi:MAG: hypothetical protein KBD41_15655 [Saprospiraceae bacterium]|nr:hypothetical protein [Saprospiraceae bacterium]